MSAACNVERLHALEMQAAGLRGAVQGVNESATAQAEHARNLRIDALQLSPIAWSPLVPLQGLATALEAEVKQLAEGKRVNPDHVVTARNALTAVRRAITAKTRADALRAECERMQAKAAPLVALAAACRKFADAQETAA